MNIAFMTHHGLKVRLHHDFCVHNLEESTILPWYTSIEAFDSLRGILSIIGAIVMMLTHRNPVYAGITIAILYFVGFIISQSFFFMAILNLLYGLFYMAYSFIQRLLIPYITLLTITFISKEYIILLVYIAVRIACSIAIIIIYTIVLKYYKTTYGIAIGDVEITAIKLLQLYSKNNIEFKQWLLEYSNYLSTVHLGLDFN